MIDQRARFGSRGADGSVEMTAQSDPTSDCLARQADVTLLTCSYRGDFDLCRILCDSVDQFVPTDIEHVLLVPTSDMELFAGLANARRRIASQDKLLPGWFRKVPLPRWRRLFGLPRRNFYVTPYSMPVRGWIAQQIMKIAAACDAETEIIMNIDSDEVFIRPLRREYLMSQEGAVRFYRNPEPVDLESHRNWHLNANRLFGLPPDDRHGGEYIDPTVVWRRSVMRKMIQHIEDIGKRDWRITLARTPHFSECILYGVFAERVLGLAEAGLAAQSASLCHSRWTEGFQDEADEQAFIEALKPDHTACVIQSTLPVSLTQRKRIIESLMALAATQDANR